MTYTPYYPGGWLNEPSTSTPIVAAALNNMENGISGAQNSVQTFTSSGTLTLAVAETTVFLNGPTVTLTLPDATASSAKVVTIKLIYPFAVGTISPVDGQTIDGYVSYALTAQYQWVTLASDGSNWLVTSAKPGGPVAVTTATLPAGTTGRAYSASLAAVGGWPGYTWSVRSGTVLPEGLSLSPSGVISGTPAVAVTGSFTVQVTDSVGTSNTASLSITIGGGIIFVQQSTVSHVAFTAAPVFANPTTAGNLLVAHIGCNGSAAPTTSAPGWVVQAYGVTNAWFAIAYKLNCAANETPPQFTGSSTTDMWAYLEEWSGAQTSGALDQTAVSTDGAPQWTATFSSLSTVPGELLVSSGYWNGSNTGGTVAVQSFTDNIGGNIASTLVQGGDGFGQYFAGASGIAGPTGSSHNEISLGLSVFAGGNGMLASFKPAASAPPGNPTILTSSLPDGSTNLPYSTTTLAAENGVPPYTWSLASGSMPAGLALSSGGVISGTPTVAAVNSVHLEVTDSVSSTGLATLGLTVAQTPTPTFTTTAQQGTSQLYTVPSIVGTTQGVPVNNNVWNPITGWASALSVVDPTDWWVVANFPAGNTAVSSYPSLGCYFNELPLSSFTKLTSSYSEVMNPSTGSQCWAGYDIWLNNWANEIMVHHDLARFNPYDNAPLATGVSFGGSNGITVASWDLHLYGAAEYVWQPAAGFSNVQVGNVDILQMLTWMITNGFLPAVNTVTAIGYGWEICSTGGLNQFFKVNAFALDAVYA